MSSLCKEVTKLHSQVVTTAAESFSSVRDAAADRWSKIPHRNSTVKLGKYLRAHSAVDAAVGVASEIEVAVINADSLCIELPGMPVNASSVSFGAEPEDSAARTASTGILPKPEVTATNDPRWCRTNFRRLGRDRSDWSLGITW